jgi:hypothetical protein
VFACVAVYWNDPLKGEGERVDACGWVGGRVSWLTLARALSAVLHAAGSSWVLVSCIGFIYVMAVFPKMLRRLDQGGVSGEVVLKLYTFQELNKARALRCSPMPSND